MPDVFEVLKKDHDEMKGMLAQLEDGPKARTAATDEQLAFRKRAMDQVIMQDTAHEALERRYFWPALTLLGPDGMRVARDGLRQEAEAEPVLAELGLLQPDDERFEDLLVTFIAAARAHIDYEEAHAWPLLRAAISADEAEALGELMAGVKELAAADS